jgi:membrane-associated phospholipid phosphatase
MTGTFTRIFWSLSGMFFMIIISPHNIFAFIPADKTNGVISSSTSVRVVAPEATIHLHHDSIHQIDFRYFDGRKGLKPWIAPSLLIAGGTAFHLMPGAKESVRDFMQENLQYQGHLDDYGQYAPLAAVYLLNVAGVKGKNNFGNRSALAAKSFLLSSFITTRLKVWVGAPRPNLEAHSFPSGHTTTAFTFAHFMHREYGELSPWYSIGAYTGAAATGILRMSKNAHWFPDVLMGAGVGILSTEFVYLTHQYKWDNKHLRRLDIFPFGNGYQKGLSLVYVF